MMSSEKDKKQEGNKNEITVTFNKKHLIIAILLVTLSPVAVALGITWPKFLFSHTSADANSWLQFWGSMLGGFIGTVAVIYVAYLQNAKQEEQLKIQNTLQEKLLDRQISENEKQNNKLYNLEQYKLKRETLINILNMLSEYEKAYNEFENGSIELLELYSQCSDYSNYYRKRPFIINRKNSVKVQYEKLGTLINKMSYHYLLVQDNPSMLQTLNDLKFNSSNTPLGINLDDILKTDDYKEAYQKIFTNKIGDIREYLKDNRLNYLDKVEHIVGMLINLK